LRGRGPFFSGLVACAQSLVSNEGILATFERKNELPEFAAAKGQERDGGSMAFLRNTWYVAAWENEVSRAPMARTILGRAVLLYRKEDGAAVALADRCPHRSAPLHKGKLVADNIQCPYHGLQFDSSGACAYNPSSGALPKAAAVHRYPVAERHPRPIGAGRGSHTRSQNPRIPDRRRSSTSRMKASAANHPQHVALV